MLALALAAFAVQTDDFIIIGVLPAIASDIHVSESAAGQLVTAYSLVYALTAPIWAILFARVPRRRALFWALTTFTGANAAVLLVDVYPVLMALRVVAALAASVVLPTALAAASTQAPPDRRGRYLALVMMGLTGAILAGVPLGTWVGALLGWKATFAFGGLMGGLSLLLGLATLPAGADATDEERRTFADLLRPLFDRAVAVVLILTILTVAGNLAFQTYIAVILSGLAGVTPSVLGVLLVCSGVGGLLGTQASGRLVDRFGALRSFLAAGAVFGLAMAGLALLWLVSPVPVWGVAPILMVWSAAAWAVPPSLQALMLDRAGAEAASQAMAVHSSSVYVGAAVGGVLGGAAIAVSPGLVPAAAAAAAVLGLALSPLARRPGGQGADRPRVVPAADGLRGQTGPGAGDAGACSGRPNAGGRGDR
ncbi:MFS transporter [Nocardiopsis rhodophaea]|uniref:MFS transporter n=1 Tax=Nocardiopsis rhodophaea TaxID=280238 RepID=A0ABN2SB88_9ACTN